ncbi:MAG: hypothetical protein AAGG72_08865, partial [Pseudomonadota bacterium]
MFKPLGAVFAAIAMVSCSNADAPDPLPLEASDMPKELILLAAPPDGDDYYADRADDIFSFHV